jgi:D-alanyl-D-alanine carboxypeptidase-like protein
MRLRHALTTTVTVGVLVLCAACSGGAPAADPDPSGAPGGAGTGASADPAVADDHAVAAPGPRSGVLAPADILVISPKTLDEATIEEVRKLEHVTDVEVISLSESIIENQALTVAAVDPATYRNYTPYRAAQTDQVWGRVAGGELALKSQKKDDVSLDDEDFLRLGGAVDAPRVHVGAYTPQASQIDAVVNKTWVKTLGMTPDNALLIRATGAAPRLVRGPLERLLGADTSVQLVDIATRRGLDPSAAQVAVVTGTVADAVGVFKYSVLGGGHIAPDPAWVSSHIATEVVPILGSVTCNKLIFPQLKAALQEVIDRGLIDKIHPGEYAGCYYPRFIAGSTTLSNHAFGLALDLNVPGNQRGTVGEMDRGVVEVFKKWGFAWGGDWGYTDPMHFEMNSLVNPGALSARE